MTRVAVSSDPGVLTSSAWLSEDSREDLVSVAIPGLVIYAVMGGAVLASYVSLFVLPRTDAGEGEQEKGKSKEKSKDKAGATGGGTSRARERERRRRMQTTEERAQHRVRKNYHVAALVFVVLRVVSHAAMLCAPAAADRYLLLVRRLSVVVDFSMYCLVLYWWVVCYSRSFRIGARHAIKRALVACNAAAYAAVLVLLVCWWAVYRAPQASWTGNALYEASVWCVVALNVAVAAAASLFAVTLYFRQHHEVWFLRGHRDDLVLIIAFSAVFLLCSLLRVAVFLLRPLFHVVCADWLFHLLAYYVPDAVSTALQLVVVHHTPVVDAAQADTTLIRALYTSTRSLLGDASTPLGDGDGDDVTPAATDGGCGGCGGDDGGAVIYVAPDSNNRGNNSLCANINASAQQQQQQEQQQTTTTDERTLIATSRRNYELYSRNSFTGDSIFGAGMSVPAASSASMQRAYPGSLQAPRPHAPRVADPTVDAAASFFRVDAPAVPVQPLRVPGTSTASSFRAPQSPQRPLK